MRQKLNRLLRYKTEDFQDDDKRTATTTQRNKSRASGAFSIRKFEDKHSSATQRQPFMQKDPNMTYTLIKAGSHKLKTQFFKKSDRMTVKLSDETARKSIRLEMQEKASRKKLRNFAETQTFISLITKEVKFFSKSDSKSIQLISKIIQTCEQMIEQVYSYNMVEGFITCLNQLLKQISCKSLVYLGYCLSAQCFFIYGSYSLAVYYADKALKLLREKSFVFREEREKQSELYRTVTKIFLTKNNFKTAKEFGYKYLRKAWILRSEEKQINAYDLLGKVYHELQDKSMSIYFHNRMCKGEREDMQIIRISNYQLEKAEKEERQYVVYETVETFVEGDAVFHEMLEDRFRMKNRNFQFKSLETTNPFFFHTHRSPNRNLNTYRVLERKMIEQKKSKQLHFIKPKQKGNLKKMIGEFLKHICEVRDNLGIQIHSSDSIDEVFIKTN